MKPERWHRVKAWFEQARNTPPAERCALVEAIRRQDPDSAAEVESLLAHAEADPSFLAQPALGDGVAARVNPDGLVNPSSTTTSDRMSQYQLIRMIGRGGMGVVYEAQQLHPHRLVAIKIVNTTAPIDPDNDKRLQREAQALARLKHPGIAAVYDAGRTEDGRHFFAMELINGPELSEFVRTRRLTIQQRLQLFTRICEAIHYAHQRGVVHRDLKPSNILVVDEASRDGSKLDASMPGCLDAIPKILDFGLARLTEPDIAAATVMTQPGLVLGTLAYMSPEQARGDPDEVDVRSDVYSLGVILYELVCERCPFDVDATGVGGLAQAVRRICEESPPRPGALNRALRGDLETILLKSIEKDPSR